VGAQSTRYSPSRTWLTSGFVAIALSVFSAYIGVTWTLAFIPAILLIFSGLSLVLLGIQPAVEVHDEYLKIGRRVLPWNEIRRLDRTSWLSPLVVYVTPSGGKRLLVVYAGDFESANSLLRQLRRRAKDALIDGVPYRQFWGETTPAASEQRRPMASPRYQLLRPEDEAEVERLYQRLKTVGHLDPKQSDEK
jgi:hypothetical protein